MEEDRPDARPCIIFIAAFGYSIREAYGLRPVYAFPVVFRGDIITGLCKSFIVRVTVAAGEKAGVHFG